MTSPTDPTTSDRSALTITSTINDGRPTLVVDHAHDSDGDLRIHAMDGDEHVVVYASTTDQQALHAHLAGVMAFEGMDFAPTEPDRRIEQMQAALRALADLTVKGHDATERVLDHVVAMAKRDAVRDTASRTFGGSLAYEFGGFPVKVDPSVEPGTVRVEPPAPATPAGAQQRIAQLNTEPAAAHRATRAVEAERDGLRRAHANRCTEHLDMAGRLAKLEQERDELIEQHHARNLEDRKVEQERDTLREQVDTQAATIRAYADATGTTYPDEVAPRYGVHDGQGTPTLATPTEDLVLECAVASHDRLHIVNQVDEDGDLYVGIDGDDHVYLESDSVRRLRDHLTAVLGDPPQAWTYSSTTAEPTPAPELEQLRLDTSIPNGDHLIVEAGWDSDDDLCVDAFADNELASSVYLKRDSVRRLHDYLGALLSIESERGQG